MLLREGMKVSILEGEEEIDQAIVQRASSKTDPLITDTVEIESINAHPGEQFKFSTIPLDESVWRLIFQDPFTNQEVFSQRAPVYTFKPILS